MPDKKIRIFPSILTADFSKLGEEIAAIEKAGADGVHLDIMDGQFVEPISFGSLIVEWVGRITDLPLEIHLMVKEPERYFSDMSMAGSSTIIVHLEACSSLGESIHLLDQFDVLKAVAINPTTAIESLEPFLSKIDQAVIMSVEPGYGGQDFLKGSLKKIAALKYIVQSNSFDVAIEVDGGINIETAYLAVDAGADMLVAGSAVFNRKFSVCRSVQLLRNRIREGDEK